MYNQYIFVWVNGYIFVGILAHEKAREKLYVQSGGESLGTVVCYQITFISTQAL